MTVIETKKLLAWGKHINGLVTHSLIFFFYIKKQQHFLDSGNGTIPCNNFELSPPGTQRTEIYLNTDQ